jgi:hypothetical protein
LCKPKQAVTFRRTTLQHCILNCAPIDKLPCHNPKMYTSKLPRHNPTMYTNKLPSYNPTMYTNKLPSYNPTMYTNCQVTTQQCTQTNCKVTRHSLHGARPIQSMASRTISRRYILILPSKLYLGLPSGPFPSDLSYQNVVRTSAVPHT